MRNLRGQEGASGEEKRKGGKRKGRRGAEEAQCKANEEQAEKAARMRDETGARAGRAGGRV